MSILESVQAHRQYLSQQIYLRDDEASLQRCEMMLMRLRSCATTHGRIWQSATTQRQARAAMQRGMRRSFPAFWLLLLIEPTASPLSLVFDVHAELHIGLISATYCDASTRFPLRQTLWNVVGAQSLKVGTNLVLWHNVQNIET